MRIIHWFRRDLRLSDNNALFQASTASKEVYPVFVFDTNILSKLEDQDDARISFIFDSLQEIQEKLAKNDAKLCILHGDPVDLIPKLAQEIGADAVYANEDYDPYSKKRDSQVNKQLARFQIKFELFKDHVIFSGNEVLKKDGTPYRVFTPYKNEWLRRVNPDVISDFRPKLGSLSSFDTKLKTVHKLSDINFIRTKRDVLGGEKQAGKVFNQFLKRIDGYDDNRDFIFQDSNSHLSPYLRFGCISTRYLVRQSLFLESKGAKVWLSEIIWREFYQMILDQFPHVINKEFNEKYIGIKWPGKPEHFKKWKDGQTGYPIIDAAMRCFKETGQMHNRLRMIVASFLVKDLLIDWRKGERYFAAKLLDYDLAANNGGWQWSASTGCDAQPYFRVFNPESQSKRFDPDGKFIRKWVPELADLTSKAIHAPMNVPGYPDPIVDHSTQRLLAIDLFKSAR